MNNKTGKKLFAIDANSIINREYYGIPLLSTRNGIYTNAVMGMTNKLLKYIETLSPDYCFAAFDLKAPTFRHNLYTGYKASRKKMPDELAAQLPYAKEVCEIAGFTLCSKEGYEADDILGTLAKIAEEKDIASYILTGDRDSLQLVSDKTTVLLVTNNAVTEYTPGKILETYGLEPIKLIDVKALMGDASDEIPGIKGIGEKTALKLITENNSLDEVYDRLENGTLNITPSNRKKLADGKDGAYMSRRLATICRDIPDICIDEPNTADEPDGTAGKIRVDRDKLYVFCKKLEFNSIIERLELKPPRNSEIAGGGTADAVYIADIIEKHEFEEINAGKIHEKFDKGDTLFATFDFNYDVDVVYINNNKTFCKIPFENLSDVANIFSGDYKICTDKTKELYMRFRKKNIDISPFAFDFELAGYVLNPVQSSYAIRDLTVRYTDFEASFVNKEAENLIYGSLYEKLCAELKRLELEGLYYKIEMPLAAVLADMELAGFLLDSDGIYDYGETLNKRAESIQKEIYDAVGYPFNINSPKQLGEVLFDTLKLPRQGKKNKTGYSTNADVLAKLKPLHPVINQVLEYRTLTKLKSTYCDGLVKLADGYNRRLHTSFNQTITATGRLSSTEPNLQNIPVRTAAGREIRKFFIAEEDYILVDADYSQIELRVLAHISGDETLINAFNNDTDIHRLTASQVFGVSEEEVTPEMRSSAKAVNFGIVYGISDFSLADDIGVSIYEARKYIEGYFAKYPKVKQFMEDIVNYAKENGYVKTMFNRIRYIPEIKAPNKNIAAFGERIARNTPIQGSAADIIKLAMIACGRRFREDKLKSRLLLQVHDELIIEAHKSEVDTVIEIVRNEMESVCKMSVPLVADISTGKSWYDAK